MERSVLNVADRRRLPRAPGIVAVVALLIILIGPTPASTQDNFTTDRSELAPRAEPEGEFISNRAPLPSRFNRRGRSVRERYDDARVRWQFADESRRRRNERIQAERDRYRRWREANPPGPPSIEYDGVRYSSYSEFQQSSAYTQLRQQVALNNQLRAAAVEQRTQTRQAAVDFERTRRLYASRDSIAWERARSQELFDRAMNRAE